MKSATRTDVPPRERGMSPFKKGVLVLLALVFVGSVLARALSGGEPAEPPPAGVQPQVTGPDGFLPGLPPGGAAEAPPPAEEEEQGLERLLPVLTESSFFALIGFALGYATRKLVKLALVFLAIFFVGIQALAYAEVMTVDWGHAIELVNGLVLNLRADQPISEVLKEKVPAAGALLVGYFLGFRRG